MHNIYAQGVDTPRPPYRPLDRALEAAALAALLVAFVLPIYYWGSLPDQIPHRFDGAGNPTTFGSRGVIFVFPVVATILYGACTLPLLIPLRMHNYMGPRTPENWQTQARLMRVWLTALKVGLVGTVALSIYDIARVATQGGQATAGALPTLLGAIFGSMGLWLFASFRAAQRAKADLDKSPETDQLGSSDPDR